MLSSSLPSGSAVSLFMPYFLGNCGSQIWSHVWTTDTFSVSAMKLCPRKRHWMAKLQNGGRAHNPSASSALFTLRILSNPWPYKHLKNEDVYLRHHSKTTHTWERQGAHKVLVTPQTPSAELMEGSEHCSGCRVKGGQEMRRRLPNHPKVLDNSTNIINTAFAP